MDLDFEYGGHRSYSRNYIIPQDPHDYKILEAVCNRTREDVYSRYQFPIDDTWIINTIANSFLETMLHVLSYTMKSQSMNDGIGIDFYDILRITVSYKKNESAEKEGNINVFFEPGERIERLISEGPVLEYTGDPVALKDAFGVEDPEENKFYLDLDSKARYEIAQTYALRMRHEYQAIAITYTFFVDLFSELLVRAAAESKDAVEGDETLVTVNFNDNVEIHCAVKDGLAQFMMRPGKNAKLIIKSDALTEDTMGALE